MATHISEISLKIQLTTNTNFILGEITYSTNALIHTPISPQSPKANPRFSFSNITGNYIKIDGLNNFNTTVPIGSNTINAKVTISITGGIDGVVVSKSEASGIKFDKISDESISGFMPYEISRKVFPNSIATSSSSFVWDLDFGSESYTTNKKTYRLSSYRFSQNQGIRDLVLTYGANSVSSTFDVPSINLTFTPNLPIINNFKVVPENTYVGKNIKVSPVGSDEFVYFPHPELNSESDHAWYYAVPGTTYWKKLIKSNSEFTFSMNNSMSFLFGIAAINDLENYQLTDILETPPNSNDPEGSIGLPLVQSYKIHNTNSIPKFINISDIPIFDFNIIQTPSKNYYSTNEDIYFSVQLENNFPQNEISDVKWSIDGEDISDLDISIPFDFSSSIVKKYTISATITENINSTTVTKSISVIFKEFKQKYKRVYVAIPPEQKELIKKTNGELYSDEEFRDELFASILEANANNSLFLGIRTWAEAGKITNIEKATRKGIPCVAITLQNRVGKHTSGVEDFNYNSLPINIHDKKDSETMSLPSPRGCVFSTINNSNTNSIYLSSINNISFEDKKINSTIQKDGLSKHHIVLFSQSKNKSNFNVFGSLNLNENIDFSIFPFQPYMTILRKDHVDLFENRMFSCSVYSSSNKENKRYRAESIFYIKPFDSLSKKFKSHQDLNYISPSVRYGLPDIISWNDNSKYLSMYSSFPYKGPRGFNDAPIYEDGRPYLSYEQTGIIYSQNEDSGSVLKYNDFFGNPYYYGNKEDSNRVSRLGFFNTINTVGHNIGDNISSEDNIVNNQNSLLNIDVFGNNNSSISHIISKTNLRSNFLSKQDLFSLTPVNVENRFIAYSVKNRLYLWDQYSNSDMGPYYIPEASSNINNLIGIREFISDTRNESINILNNKIYNLPLSPKYFSNMELFNNFNYNKGKNIWDINTSRLGVYENNNQNFTLSRSLELSENIYTDNNVEEPYNVIMSSIYENSLYFSTKDRFGFYTVNKHSFIYSVDLDSGNILENTYGTYTYQDSLTPNYIDKKYLSISLNEENEKQFITISGERDGIGFISNESIILANKIIPKLDIENNKVFINELNKNDKYKLKIKTSQWIPDNISICGTQLSNIEEYKKAFTKDKNKYEYNITSNGSINEISINCKLSDFWNNSNNEVVSGNHIISIGLENCPNGSSSDGKRYNYEQIPISDLLSNFSTSIVIVNTKDIEIINSVDPNNYIKTNIIINNVFLSKMPNSVSNYVFSSNDNTLEIKGLNIYTDNNVEVYDLITSNNRRLENCTLILEDNNIGKKDTFKITKTTQNSITIALPPVVSQNSSFYISNIIDSFKGKKFAVAAFAPNQIMYFDNRTSFHSDKINLNIKEFKDNKIIYEASNYIANSNLINIFLYEQFKENYIKENIYETKVIINGSISDSDSISSSGSVSTQINIGLYRNYDQDLKIFTNNFIQDKFSRFYPKYNLINYLDKIFVKISSTNSLDIDKPMKFVIKNLTNHLNTDEKIVYDNSKITALNENNIDDKRGSNLFLVEIQTSVDSENGSDITLNNFLSKDFNEIELAFEGFDIKGTKIQYGSSQLLN